MALVKEYLNGSEVEFDNTEFEICDVEEVWKSPHSKEKQYLHYIGNGINVTNPKGNTSCFAMFMEFKGSSLDLSNFDTSKVENMEDMFWLCKDLKELDLSSFNTENVTNMNNMFLDCRSLEKLNLSNFNTCNTKYMLGMFSSCEKLEFLDISNFNTSNVSEMSCMFMDCKSLKELDLSSFNISRVKSLEYMFFGCYNLLKLDLSSFKFTGDKIINYMFWACSKLEELKIDNQFYQFFVDNYYLLFKNKKKAKIIPVNKLDKAKAIEDLFY